MKEAKLGKAKPGWKVSPRDFTEYPVWVNDLDEENYDEEHEKPLLPGQSVNKRLMQVAIVSLGMKVAGGGDEALCPRRAGDRESPPERVDDPVLEERGVGGDR